MNLMSWMVVLMDLIDVLMPKNYHIDVMRLKFLQKDELKMILHQMDELKLKHPLTDVLRLMLLPMDVLRLKYHLTDVSMLHLCYYCNYR